MACLEFSEFVQLTTPHVEALNSVAEQYPDSLAPGACEAFSHQVRIVEGLIVSHYTMAATLAKRSESLGEIATLWQQMGSLCNTALITVKSLKDRYPYCGTPALYDLLLDYKIACGDRYDRAMEEVLCLKTPTPKELFPALS